MNEKNKAFDQIVEETVKSKFEYNIVDRADLKEIKWLLTNDTLIIGAPFNTNVLKIALNLKETKIASCIAHYYKINFDEKMILRAIISD